MIVTLDGTDGSSLDHSSGMFPTFATRTPRAVTPNPLRVRRIDCRSSLRDRNLGCPTCRPFRFPDSESNQFRKARRASRHAWTGLAPPNFGQADGPPGSRERFGGHLVAGHYDVPAAASRFTKIVFTTPPICR